MKIKNINLILKKIYLKKNFTNFIWIIIIKVKY